MSENKNSYNPYHALHHQDHHNFAMYNHVLQPVQNPSDQLQGFVEYNTLSAAFDLSCGGGAESADTVPVTPNSSEEVVEGEEDSSKSKRMLVKMEKGNLRIKVKKKEEKNKKEARFAFITKSEVDNLEDGYRWRKYGQKAIKNSPFPRSYYRCTSQKCNVKKRFERSCQDPTVVITTYEGQHNHHSPATIRDNAAAMFHPSLFAPAPLPFSTNTPQDFTFLPSNSTFDDQYCSFLMDGMASSFLYKPYP